MKKDMKDLTVHYARRLAEIALEMGAIKLSVDKPFTWASGYKMPIYNDNRQFLSKYEYRKIITDAFAQMADALGKDEFDCIAGTSTAGIPHATSLADRLQLPLSYVRSFSKDHGLKKQIEGLAGKDYASAKVLLIEDLISTGGSSIEALKAIRNANGICSNCFAIFTYGLDKASSAFDALEPACNIYTILDYDSMLETALSIGYIDDKAKKSLEEWRRSPFSWQDRFAK
ncbi:MAG TPA: orotate phosphoribosyltransferase [Spirochaetaceae bacterium]|nr:orotate phosphoribosyltransferase [Spirochaetaceae bacterium]